MSSIALTTPLVVANITIQDLEAGSNESGIPKFAHVNLPVSPDRKSLQCQTALDLALPDSSSPKISQPSTTPSNNPRSNRRQRLPVTHSPLNPIMAASAPPSSTGSTKLDAVVQNASAASPAKLSGFQLYSRFALAGAVCCSVTHGGLTPVDV